MEESKINFQTNLLKILLFYYNDMHIHQHLNCCELNLESDKKLLHSNEDSKNVVDDITTYYREKWELVAK